MIAITNSYVGWEKVEQQDDTGALRFGGAANQRLLHYFCRRSVRLVWVLLFLVALTCINTGKKYGLTADAASRDQN